MILPIKKLPIGARRKTNWGPVLTYLQRRKGKPLQLGADGSTVYVNSRPATNYKAAWGTATVNIACGLCGVINSAYKWSLHGGGKKCEVCGSKITPTKTFAYLDRLVPDSILSMIAEPKQEDNKDESLV